MKEVGEVCICSLMQEAPLEAFLKSLLKHKPYLSDEQCVFFLAKMVDDAVAQYISSLNASAERPGKKRTKATLVR
jgi:hypothetical protein